MTRSSMLPARRSASRPLPPCFKGVAEAIRPHHTAVQPSSSTSLNELDFRQLRHHTNNALQRLLADIAAASDLQRSEDGRTLLGRLEERILISAAISDALFGFTRAPPPLAERLQELSASLVKLHGNPRQAIEADVVVAEPCRAALKQHPALAQPMLRVTRELLENALKHGMHARAQGRVVITVVSGPAAFSLSVADDGWGLDAAGTEGRTRRRGLELVRDLAAPFGGTLSLHRHDGWTITRVSFPADAPPVGSIAVPGRLDAAAPPTAGANGHRGAPRGTDAMRAPRGTDAMVDAPPAAGGISTLASIARGTGSRVR